MIPGPWNIRPALACVAAGAVLGLGLAGAVLWVLGAALRSVGVL